MNTDEVLVIRVKSGDVSAYEELIKRYETTIYKICRKILDEHEAYDAAQEVCIKVWKQIDKFEEKSKFSTWVYRITTNQCLDIIRKKKNKKVVSINQINSDDENWELEIADTTVNIEKQIEDAERNKVLKMALDELKTEYKEIIILRDIQNLSYDEISNNLDISLGTVKSRLSRARNTLKNILLQDKEPFSSFWRHNNRKKGI